jgi:tRNA (adenine22-N1)-methyltransferase
MLSKRLETIQSFVDQQAKVADVGCDHAILACSLVLEGISDHVIATDLNEGPLNQAKATIDQYGLYEKIETRISDGIKSISADEVDTVIIAGMGGGLITSILEADLDKLSKINTLILQPNIGEYNLRKFLNSNGFEIIDEDIVYENKKYYEIIKAKRNNDVEKLDDRELFFGPVLVQKKTDVMIRKFEEYLPIVKKNIERIPETHQNYQRFVWEYNLISNFLGE